MSVCYHRTVVIDYATVILMGWADERLCFSLEEAEERYRNREPREEDLQRIAQLQVMLQEREQQMQQLLVCRRHLTHTFVLESIV